jgi:hypothetical protein
VPTTFSFAESWALNDLGAVQHLARQLDGQLGLKLEGEPSESAAVLRGGNQLKTRLLGGWFINPEALPKRVQILVASEPDGQRVHVRIDDTLGPIPVRDKKFGRRYEMAAQSIFAAVEQAL